VRITVKEGEVHTPPPLVKGGRIKRERERERKAEAGNQQTRKHKERRKQANWVKDQKKVGNGKSRTEKGG